MHFSIIAAVVSLTSMVNAVSVDLHPNTFLGGTTYHWDVSNGACQNVDGDFNDQAHSAKISGGQCVFWENYDCHDDHTSTLSGVVNDFNNVCSGGWQKRISSFKCCDSDNWCAGSEPRCT